MFALVVLVGGTGYPPGSRQRLHCEEDPLVDVSLLCGWVSDQPEQVWRSESEDDGRLWAFCPKSRAAIDDAVVQELSGCSNLDFGRKGTTSAVQDFSGDELRDRNSQRTAKSLSAIRMVHPTFFARLASPTSLVPHPVCT